MDDVINPAKQANIKLFCLDLTAHTLLEHFIQRFGGVSCV